MVRKLDAVAAANERIRYTSSVCGGCTASLVVAVLFDFLQKGDTSWFTWISVLCAVAIWYVGYMHLSWLKPED